MVVLQKKKHRVTLTSYRWLRESFSKSIDCSAIINCAFIWVLIHLHSNDFHRQSLSTFREEKNQYEIVVINVVIIVDCFWISAGRTSQFCITAQLNLDLYTPHYTVSIHIYPCTVYTVYIHIGWQIFDSYMLDTWKIYPMLCTRSVRRQ